MIITHENNGRTWLFAQVPIGSHTFELCKEDVSNRWIVDFFKHEHSTATGDIELEAGSYRIVGLAKNLTEAQAEAIAELNGEQYLGSLKQKYRGYTPMSMKEGYAVPSFSLNSLLLSHNLKPESTLIIESK